MNQLLRAVIYKKGRAYQDLNAPYSSFFIHLGKVDIYKNRENNHNGLQTAFKLVCSIIVAGLDNSYQVYETAYYLFTWIN